MKKVKDIFLVARTGLQETFSDKKIIVLLLIIGFIVDNGVRRMVNNAMIVGQPIGFLEGFIMCINHWYYIIIFLMGFIFILSAVPRLNGSQLLLIYRTGKKNWLLGEVLQVAISAFVYILILFLGCMISCAKYSFIGNKWSNFTNYYKTNYESLLSDNNRYIDQQVFKYYMPYQSAIHGFLLLLLCLILMGTIILFFSIIDKKAIGIILNMALVIFVLIFNEYRSGIMWISPFCHAVLALHNVYVFKQFSVPLFYSYIYMIGIEGILLFFSLKKLKRKMFY